MQDCASEIIISFPLKRVQSLQYPIFPFNNRTDTSHSCFVLIWKVELSSTRETLRDRVKEIFSFPLKRILAFEISSHRDREIDFRSFRSESFVPVAVKMMFVIIHDDARTVLPYRNTLLDTEERL